MNMCIYCVYFGSTFNYTFESRDFSIVFVVGSAEVRDGFPIETWWFQKGNLWRFHGCYMILRADGEISQRT